MISGEVENRCGRIRENLFKEETGGGIFFTVLFLPSSIGALARHDIDTTNIEKNILKRNREKLKKKGGEEKRNNFSNRIIYIIASHNIFSLFLSRATARTSIKNQRDRSGRENSLGKSETGLAT